MRLKTSTLAIATTTAEVITETGELLGRVRNFKFNRENGKVYSLIIASRYPANSPSSEYL